MQPFFENAIVLTGASTGIGRELALQLAKHGAWLVLAARNAAQLEEVAAACQAKGGRAIAVPTDVGIQSDCERLVQKTIETFGRVDTLINNAAISMWSPFEELKDLDILEKMMRVNYLGSAWCTAYALPHLKKSKGRIVVVSSLAGKNGVPTRSGYAASKHAQTGFFDSLRIELKDSGVTVTTIYPGYVATEIRERAFNKDGKPLEKSPVQEGKIMTAEECARQIVQAMELRKRELVMTARGKLAQWIKPIAPWLVDHFARKAVEKGI